MQTRTNITDIRTFVLIAELGSFTKASEALDVSRSHVSRQLSALEDQMGVSLIMRTTRTQRLTEIGEAFYQQCRNALNSIDQAVLAAVDDTKEVRGTIRINCVGGHIGEDIITALVSGFMAEHPDVDITLEFCSHRVDLITDQFDIAFRMGELDDAGFIGRKLFDIKINTLASRAYLEKHGVPETPRDLKKHRCLRGSVNNWRYTHADNAQDVVDIHIDGQFICKNGRALVQAALDGNGIVRLPEMYCQQEIDDGLLIPVFEDWEITSVPFYMIYHRHKYQPMRLKAFTSYVADHFAKL